MEFIEPLLAEQERAFAAIDRKIMLHLAARRDPVALNQAGGTIGKAQKGPADIIDRHGFLAALSVGALVDHRHAIAHHAADRAAQKLRRCQRVAADIGQRPAARRVVAEGIGAIGVGHVIFGVGPAIAADFPQLARVNHGFCVDKHGVAQIVETDLRLDPPRLGGVGHFGRIGGQRRQRLFAIDVLARRNRRHGHFLVQRVGGGDVDQINRGVSDQGAPVGGGMVKPQPLARLFRRLGRDVGDGMKVEIIGQVEHPGGRGKAEHMGLAHETGADQTDGQAGFGHGSFLG